MKKNFKLKYVLIPAAGLLICVSFGKNLNAARILK